MIHDTELQQLLHLWSQTDPVCLPRASQEQEKHLDDTTLFKMAQPSGLATAQPNELKHLSGCPLCLQQFAEWHQAMIDASQKQSRPTIMSYGLRQAAASPGSAEPKNLTSTCGQFILGIYPEVDNPKRGMITLDLAPGTQGLQEKFITIRDANATLLLDGSLHNNRLARIIDNLDEIDLSAWTISEQEPQS